MIQTAQIVDGAIGAPACQVATAVHALPGSAVGIGDKAFGGQRRTPLITPGQIDPGDVQLPCHAHRQRIEIGIKNMDLRIGNRAANGHAVAVFATGPGGDVDGRFGRTVEVVQLAGGLPQHLTLQLGRQGFTAANDPLQRSAKGQFTRRYKGLQHRRHEVQRGDAVRDNQFTQGLWITVGTRWRHHQCRAAEQRPEELPDRDVEAVGGFLQHPVAGI